MGTLYLVATPIGNLEDISLRAMRVLKEVSLIAAEDTRRTRKLLSHYDIHTPLTSYHEHNKRAKLGYLLKQLAEGDVAVVSEAGTPGMSDPGYELVVACIERGVAVVAVPGASVLPAAVVVSGLPTSRFLFLGFLSRREGERKRVLVEVALLPYTLVALEAPHRLRRTLVLMREVLGERRMALCRELTKYHEEVFRGTPSTALERFTEPLGEFTLVIEGAPAGRVDMAAVEVELGRLKGQGLTARDALAEMSGVSGLSRRELYRLWLKLKA
ncbi:MAG: 16S rRNA (cytidine(1402)-2'-O)-methyltransferase [Dehalococcoidia bacterium]|nr:16S rRNA (cytidine(1402)-2'-O)-methyltransferase [Dehalococcoidia bacterium]